MTQGLGIDPAGIWAVFIMVQCAFRPQRNVYIPLNTQSPEKTKCWETDMDTLLYVKQITNKSYCTAQGYKHDMHFGGTHLCDICNPF